MERSEKEEQLSEKQKQLVESTRAEASALFTAAQTYNARNDQLVAGGLTIIGAVVALAGKKFFDEVLLGVPIALMVLATYATQVETDIRVMNVARERCEQMLERQLGAPAMVYQTLFAKYRRGEYIKGITRLGKVMALLTGGVAVAGGFVAHDKDWWVLPAYVITLALTAWCLWSAQREKDKAKNAARTMLLEHQASDAKQPDGGSSDKRVG